MKWKHTKKNKVEKPSETKNSFFGRINKTGKFLNKLAKTNRKKETQINKIRGERGEITTGDNEIQKNPKNILFKTSISLSHKT